MSEPSQPEPSQPAGRLSEVRSLLTVATHRLLGDTISVSDEDWRAPSRLPGWSRGHVATHLARQADGLVRLAEWARTGEAQSMYDSTEQRDADIEAGSSRSGLDLQIDLDTSAGRLGEAFDALDHVGGWDAEIELRGGIRAPARMLPLTRLGEVVLHHIDLAVGYSIAELEPDLAGWLLEWAAFRLGKREEFPGLRLEGEGGLTVGLGTPGTEPRVVTGDNAHLLGWLTRRSAPDGVRGADGLVLPPF